jgi:hypothetical protein
MVPLFLYLVPPDWCFLMNTSPRYFYRYISTDEQLSLISVGDSPEGPLKQLGESYLKSTKNRN